MTNAFSSSSFSYKSDFRRKSVFLGNPVSFSSKTGLIRDVPYSTSTENSLELIELSIINKVSLV